MSVATCPGVRLVMASMVVAVVVATVAAVAMTMAEEVLPLVLTVLAGEVSRARRMALVILPVMVLVAGAALAMDSTAVMASAMP
eukprot:COSAG05_NODE_847_length_6998_cov_1.434121_2_plen_84_part_00